VKPEPLIKLFPVVIYYEITIQRKAVRDQWLLQCSMKGNSMCMEDVFKNYIAILKMRRVSSNSKILGLRQNVNKRISTSMLKEEKKFYLFSSFFFFAEQRQNIENEM
jgi:hypothetical protein